MKSKKKTEAAQEAAQEATPARLTLAERRVEVLRELHRICGELIADRIDWDEVERRSSELFSGATLQEQGAMLAALDGAIGRIRAGLLKAGGVYRFREVFDER